LKHTERVCSMREHTRVQGSPSFAKLGINKISTKNYPPQFSHNFLCENIQMPILGARLVIFIFGIFNVK
jgi:hypothetical protein